MNITLYEFNSLSYLAKGEALLEYGVHIAERKEVVFGYILYQLSNFYVEVSITTGKTK